MTDEAALWTSLLLAAVAGGAGIIDAIDIADDGTREYARRYGSD